MDKHRQHVGCFGVVLNIREKKEMVVALHMKIDPIRHASSAYHIWLNMVRVSSFTSKA
jgi:hypothetical protein